MPAGKGYKPARTAQDRASAAAMTGAYGDLRSGGTPSPSRGTGSGVRAQMPGGRYGKNRLK